MIFFLKKSVPLQARSGPECSRKLRFPDYVTMTQDGGKVISLKHRPAFPQDMLLVLISVTDWIDPRTIVRSEGLCQWKIPVIPAGKEPATFRFAAQHLNHCPTAIPSKWYKIRIPGNECEKRVKDGSRLLSHDALSGKYRVTGALNEGDLGALHSFRFALLVLASH